MTIAEWGAIGELLGAIGVIASLLYLSVQVRYAKQASAREAAFELIRSFQTIEFTRVLQTLFEVPPGSSRHELERHFEGRMDELLAFLATWESIGILAHRRQIGLDLVADFFSHPTLRSWDVAQRYVEEFRRDMERDTPWEWFQWLAERIREHERRAPPRPACEQYRAWMP